MKKIVYFDENSATDYLTIINGGSLVISDADEQKVGGLAEIKVGAKLKLLFDALFVKGSAKLDSNIGAYTSGENLIKTTISNTTLSDFIDLVGDENYDVEILEDYRVCIVKNSIAYFQTITPYLAMAEGKVKVENDMAISINKIYDTLKLGKGYYELLAIKGEEKKIFRFNNAAFKNNYGLSDLTQMNLKYYGVKVGTGNADYFDFIRAFSDDEKKTVTNFDEILTMEENNDSLDIYDIILAGVE